MCGLSDANRQYIDRYPAAGFGDLDVPCISQKYAVAMPGYGWRQRCGPV